MAGAVAGRLQSYGTFVALLGVAAGVFPSLASWTEVVSLETFHRTPEGDWTGGLVGIQPGAILLASGFFNMVVLAGAVTSEWVRKNQRKLVGLALLAFVLGAASSGIFYWRYGASQTELVTAARAVEAGLDGAPAASGPPSASVVRDRAVATTGRSAMADSLIGLPYCMFFALWTLCLALFSEKYHLSVISKQKDLASLN